MTRCFRTQTWKIECNIDDMSSEAFSPLFDELFKRGALDVFVTPIQMKKSRPAVRVTVLGKLQDEQRLVNSLIGGTTTLGVRTHRVSKHMIPRERIDVPTRYGTVKVKIGVMPDGKKRWKVEHDDVARVARDNSIYYLQAHQEVEDDVRKEIESGE